MVQTIDERIKSEILFAIKPFEKSMNERMKLLNNKLYESKNYIVSYNYEYPYLIDKRSGMKIELHDHYGNPSCALIDKDEKWCCVGGDGICIYDICRNKEYVFLKGGNYFIHSLTMKRLNELKIIIDPWSENHGTWILKLDTLELIFQTAEPNMIGKPYQENLILEGD